VELARKGDKEAVLLYLNAGMSPNAKDSHHSTALMKATRYPEVVQVLLDHGARMNTRDKWDGSTALIYSSEEGQLQTVNLLLNAGARTNIRDDWGWTALLYAAARGDMDIVKSLIDHGADVNIVTAYYPTDIGPPRGQLFTNRVKALLGFDIFAPQEQAWTALILAAEFGQKDIAKVLLDAGANPHVCGMDGGSALMWAAGNGNREIVRMLLKKNARATGQKSPSQAAMVEAILRNDVESVKESLAKGADPNAVIFWQRTPLMISAKLGYAEIARVLLEHGADMNARTKWGERTALLEAADKGRSDVVNLLLDHGADIETRGTLNQTPLMEAAEEGRVETVNILLDRGADLKAINKDEMNALESVLFNALVDAGWSWGETCEESEMALTPELIVSDPDAYERRKDVIKTLIDRGADVNSAGIWGMTLLMEAATSTSPEIVQLLLDKGAGVNLKTEDGRTALMEAASYGIAQNVQLLLDNGADLNAKDNEGHTALDLAMLKGHADVVYILKKASGTKQDRAVRP
jgi:ankyrin repeat protein